MAELLDRDKHESGFARRVARLMGRHRRELEDLMGTPPDPSRVPQSFWDRVEKEMNEEIFLLLLLIFDVSSIQHQPPDGFAQSQIEQVEREKSQWVENRSREFGQGYSENTRRKLIELSRKWEEQRQTGQQGATQEQTADTSADDLQRLFGPDRAEGMAISETTDATSAASEATKRIAGELSSDDTWRTSEQDNVCPICKPLNRTKRFIWSMKFPNGPKAHYRCNCWIEYAADVKRATEKANG